MKRKLWAADLVLLALSAAGVVHLRREWMEARAHRRAVLHKRFQPMPALATTLPPVEAPVKVAGYADIARKMLFSEDRSSAVAIELPPPKAASMPPLPFFHGVMVPWRSSAKGPMDALFYKTLNGAGVGDLFMSLIHTCEFNGANPFDYLTELQRLAEGLKQNPSEWMPWNYRETLARFATPAAA